MIKKILNGEDVSKCHCKSRVEKLLQKRASGSTCDDVECCSDIEKLIKKLGEEAEDTGLVGTTWTFNDPYTGEGIEDGVDSSTTYNITYTVDGATATWEKIIVGYDSTTHNGKFIDYFLSYMGNLTVYPTTPTDGADSKWLDQGKRTITITGGTDVANADFIAWLEANATQQ